MPANHVLSVRLPLDVFERLAALAARERRSINAQLIRLIEEGAPEMSTPTNPTTDMVAIEGIGSSSIAMEAEKHGITHARFLAEGGEGENHITVYALRAPGADYEFRVARTNAFPVWEEEDVATFLELLESVGIEL